jgi:hypothetical protein
MPVMIPSAKISPRIVNGVLYWYEGDTFRLHLSLELTDGDGENISIADTAEITVTFYDRTKREVKAFSFTGKDAVGGTIVLSFDDSVTNAFPRGDYTYRVAYRDEYKHTIVHDNDAVVE